MHFDYTLKLDLPLDEAWLTLMDLERIAPCMPGATIESGSGDTYTGRLKVKLGPMEMTYRGEIKFTARDDAAKTAVVDANAKEIKGRGAARTQVDLSGTAVPGGSEIVIASEFTVSGKAAQFGRGVMEEVGAQLMDDFAARLGARIRESAADAEATTSTAPAPSPAPNAPAAAAAPVAHDNNEDALDLGHAVWTPLIKRLRVPLVIAAALALVYALL
jgi:carbon monoxide dehydrogenase subunit G